jgi:cardiolipin synthase
MMQKDYKNKIITVPNILTLVRLLLIPVIVWLYCFEKNYTWTAVVLILSGITDLVDGFVARKFNMISELGKIIDPIADKLTQFVVLICLVTRFSAMLIPCLILMTKEIISGIVAMCAIRKSGKVDGADWHGKVSTFMLYAMMILHVLWVNIPIVASNIMILLCTAMMIFSFILYNIRNLTTYKEFKQK